MTNDNRRAWEVVLESIERDLISGRLKPGDRLPGERALATELGVGRSSVREALRVLEVLGLVRSATGSGPLAGAIIVATPAGGMSLLMRLQVATNGFPVADIVRTRLLLETAIAAELAGRTRHPGHPGHAGHHGHHGHHGQPGQPGRPHPADLTAVTQLLDAMDSPDLTPADFLALDAQFHVALAEASGNLVVTAMMAGLRNSIEGYVLAGVGALPSWSTTVARLRTEHRGILVAIRTADVAGARSQIHDHIANYYAESKLTADPSPPRASPHPPRASPQSPLPTSTPQLEESETP